MASGSADPLDFIPSATNEARSSVLFLYFVALSAQRLPGPFDDTKTQTTDEFNRQCLSDH